MPEEPFRVVAYVDSKDQSKLAQQILQGTDPTQVTVYDGVVEGIATQETFKQLYKAGLILDSSGPRPVQEPETLYGIPSAADSSTPLPQASVQAMSTERETRPEHDAAYHVTLKGPITSVQRQQLKEHGIDTCSFTPPVTYRMMLSPEQREFLQSCPWIEQISEYGAEDTVCPDAREAIDAAKATVSGGFLAEDGSAVQAIVFDLLLHRSEDLEKVETELADIPGATILDTSDRLIRFKIDGDPSVVDRLAAQPEIQRIDRYRPTSFLADESRKLLGVDEVCTHTTLDGRGQIVGIFDSGIDAGHQDLSDRVASYEPVPGAVEVDTLGHGTHVAGIIAGTGKGSNGMVRGLAPGAQLVVFSLASETGDLMLGVDIGKLLQKAVDKGARIINLSWGTPISSSYDFGSLALDRFVHENAYVLVVVAAGNSGAVAQGNIDFRSVGTPATARNALTVGACSTSRAGIGVTWGEFRHSRFPDPPAAQWTVAGDPNAIACISSRGPTEMDGVKPDVVAPGTCILSTKSSKAGHPNVYWDKFDPTQDPRYNGALDKGLYAYCGGTSMAAPVVAGAAAIVRQYLMDERGFKDPGPSAALMKGLLIASAQRLPVTPRDPARDIGYPDFDQGFGRIALDAILPHALMPQERKLAVVDVPNDSADALESRAAIGGARKSFRTYTFKIVEGSTSPFKVVLCWTDYFGNGLQNNLQLDVRGPNNTVLIGNQQLNYLLDPLFVATNTQGFPFDKRNNTEMVTLENPPAGEYRLRVVAENTPFPPQGYSLVVIGPLDSEELTLATTF